MRQVALSTKFVACLFALASGSTPVLAAICSPFVPHVRTVGKKAGDSSCNDATIQSAIDNAVCPNTQIYVTDEQAYTGQALTIKDKSLSIVGSSATSCANATSTGGGGSPPTTPQLTTRGNGNQSVFDISGNSTVTLQFLEIAGGGGGTASHGGGVNFNGTGSLTIDTSLIDLNTANFGGGIEMNGSGGSATLTLSQYTVIESNTASGNGGGINIEGNAQLLAIQPFTTIGFNHAPNGKGGGVAVVGPARADIGSPGYDALPVINGNDAALGGGISILASSGQNADVELFTTDPDHPVTVSGNFAAQAGGAIYLKPFATGPGFASLCAFDFRIDGNSAPEGSALYGDMDAGSAGSSVYFNQSVCGSSFVSTPCSTGAACNSLDGNASVDGINRPTPGSVIFAQDLGITQPDRFVLRNNTGAHAIRLTRGSGTISNCLIADNDFTAEEIRLDGGGGSAHIDGCTIVNNANHSGSVIHAEHDLTLINSIIDQPSMPALSIGNTPVINAAYLVAANPTGLPVRNEIVQGEPIYINPAAGNYHLVAFIQNGKVTSSVGIDFTPASGYLFDLDGNARDVRVPQVPVVFGAQDLGCYEAQPIADRIFGDALGDPMSVLK